MVILFPVSVLPLLAGCYWGKIIDVPDHHIHNEKRNLTLWPSACPVDILTSHHDSPVCDV